jgi:hypothetical protein
MKATLLATPALLVVFSGIMPAANSQLLGLVMPDVKVLADINVAQAKASPFGQYVLSQMTANDSAGLQQLTSLTGFDPTQDVNELLLASDAATGSQHGGLAVASGIFNVSSITTFATGKGAATETYSGVTILEDPKQTHGIAFLSGSLVAAGDIADVKAAIDRSKNPSILPASLVTQVNQLSAANDAWGLTTVPPSSLGKGGPLPPSTGDLQNALQTVQSVAGGVKFGATVTLTIQAQADNAQDATSLAGVVQFLANMAELQAGQQNPQAATALQSLTATAQGNTVTIALSVPEDQFQQLVQLKPNASHPRRLLKK